MDEGVGGFFKGVGKGVVGLVARPTGGIVDFASGTFDSVKRAAEVTQEVSRVRPARFLNPDDRVVKHYNMTEAVGNKILLGNFFPQVFFPRLVIIGWPTNAIRLINNLI